MNETTLNALINLFAVFSAISESKKEDAILNFSQYLELHLGITSSNEYLKLFEELLDLYGLEGEVIFPIDMDEQAKNISNNIKSRLAKNEQVMVFIRFLELAKSGNIKKAEKLFSILAEVFEIGPSELEKFKQFIFHKTSKELTSSDFLLVDSVKEHPKAEFKHWQLKHLDGEIIFLKSGLIGHFIFIFNGREEITLEGNPIVPGRFYALKEGGIIRGQRIEPIYYTDIIGLFHDQQMGAPFIFEGNEIEFKFKNSDNGLHRFSFTERSGQLIAVMGGSGVGKSTLLNILNGNIPVQHGEITINQFNIHTQKKKIEGLIGFVPQDDLLFEDLTVWENLYYNARLCFDKLSDAEIQEKVSKVLNELELYSFKDLKVGSPLKKFISGGQRKRLNIALELIREPSILFVDEPTSGLSSTDSEKVMLLLKQQARKGKLIMVNIHQPSSAIFKLFDKLWIMDKGGRPIYTGNPLDAIIYFKKEVNHVNADHCECTVCGNVNPEQVLEIVETKKIDSSGNFTAERRFSPQYWYKLFKERVEGKRKQSKKSEDAIPQSGFKKPGILKQFKIFFERNFRIKFTDKQYLFINLLEAPVLAVIVAYFTRFSASDHYVFFDNKSLISYLFMSIVVVLFMGMSVSAEEIIKDRKILQRESFLNLSRFSYLNSKVIFLLLLSAYQTLSFVLIGNLILGIYGMNFYFWMVLFAVAVFSNLLGLNISSAFDSVVTIYILIPLLLIPQILLCGVIVKFDDLQSKTADKDAVTIIGDLMVSRWAFEAMAVDQYENNAYMANFFDLEKEMARDRFNADLLITELVGRIDKAIGLQKLNKDKADFEKELRIVHNEIIELDAKGTLPSFQETTQLTPQKFTPAVGENAKLHLKALQKKYKSSYQKNLKRKDNLVVNLNKEEGKNHLYTLKQKYHNKSLETLVLNSASDEYYRETPNGIMQKIAPIYKAPDFTNGRAHFLSAEKHFGKGVLSTTVFNLIVIWFMCLVLYAALYFDWLRKLIHLTSKIKRSKSRP